MAQNKNPFPFESADFITVKSAKGTHTFPNPDSCIQVSDIRVSLAGSPDAGGHIDVCLTADTSAVEWIKIRWNRPLPKRVMILGDAWERGYGDLQWRGISGSRFLPWYFLASTTDKQYGFGVKVRPNAMCYWQADTHGITLVMDVRCGGEGVLLGGRQLTAAQLVSMEEDTTDSFRFAQDFCRLMCTDPIFPDAPVYGSNNWYYAYGESSEAEICKDADYLMELAQGAKNPPYMVVDDCWQEHHRLDEYNGGPWRSGNHKFPDMKGLAEKLVQKGTRPGIWVRLLLNEDTAVQDSWRLSTNGCLDPTHPQALAYMKQDVRQICEWGYQLIKHDFSTYDLFGRWGFEMNPFVTGDGWHFYNQGVTSAEAVKMLYQAIYDVTKEYGVLIIGCNTIGHLGAGLMQLNRTGDDTSGRNWERTRRMGINTLAFRLPQHRTFFDVDADCVGITGAIPWKWNRQWADVIAQSGTPLFLSAKPGVLTETERGELKEIIKVAAAQEVHKTPLDWQETDCPEVWADADGQTTYNWYDEAGLTLQSNSLKYYAYIPLQ